MGECSIFLKPHSFLLESAFCQRETSESGHYNRIVFKLLSKAVKAYPIHMNPDKKYICGFKIVRIRVDMARLTLHHNNAIN